VAARPQHERRSGVTVLGSANVDLLLRLDRLPRDAETVLAATRSAGPGGKGLNQAVASARAGARTRFVGALGSDREGSQLLEVMMENGIAPVVRRTDVPTGLAVVMVEAAGENGIVVAPGANAGLVGLTQTELDAVRGAQVLLMQLEVPQQSVAAAARTAKDSGVLVVLNAAPAATLDAGLLADVDVLVVNEGEARALAPSGPDDVDRLTDALLDRVPAVVVTLGPDGALYRDRGGERHHRPGRRVEAVDTTGAGDTFAGYLAAGLAAGDGVLVALDRANVAASLCVQRRGAVPAVPLHGEVESARRRDLP
jgi:ribokinase